MMSIESVGGVGGGGGVFDPISFVGNRKCLFFSPNPVTVTLETTHFQSPFLINFTLSLEKKKKPVKGVVVLETKPSLCGI
jgi:hypothetical protein